MDPSPHKAFLDMAARGAWRAWGDAEPNPLVGAVIVRDGRVIGAGHHRRYGGLHAEREAIARCRAMGEDPRGATLYCTLEPCRHTGKQPPCTDAVLEAGIARVVYARPDPAEVSGGGHAVLARAGVACELSLDSPNATRLSDPFVHRVRTGRAWVIAKWAQTLDGRLDTKAEGRRWISGERARHRVHRLRSRVDAVLTGIGTVEADDPLLTVRGVRRVRRVPERAVVDSSLRLPEGSALVRSVGEGVVVVYSGAGAPGVGPEGVVVVRVPEGPGGVDLGAVLADLSARGVATVLVEAGVRVLGSMFEAGRIDEAVVHVPSEDVSAAAAAAVAFAPALRGFERLRAARIGPDVEVVFRRPVAL